MPEKNIYIFGLNNQNDNIKIEFTAYDVSAPIKKGEKVGIFTVYTNDIKTGEYNAVSFSDIDELGYDDYIKKIAVS